MYHIPNTYPTYINQDLARSLHPELSGNGWHTPITSGYNISDLLIEEESKIQYKVNEDGTLDTGIVEWLQTIPLPTMTPGYQLYSGFQHEHSMQIPNAITPSMDWFYPDLYEEQGELQEPEPLMDVGPNPSDEEAWKLHMEKVWRSYDMDSEDEAGDPLETKPSEEVTVVGGGKQNQNENSLPSEVRRMVTHLM